MCLSFQAGMGLPNGNCVSEDEREKRERMWDLRRGNAKVAERVGDG